jgi:glucosamine--fructose-6-phosphate aminotransferase (isomerizing)
LGCFDLITIGVVNVIDSLIARDTECGVYLNAGREVAVASTKSFTNQCIILTMIAIWFSQNKDTYIDKRKTIISDLRNLSFQMQSIIDRTEDIKKIALLIEKKSSLFILGKGKEEAIAREGALKIKEISYIHAEGYSASSLKHGPFALLDENFPVIILNLDNNYNSKIMNCIEEILSRNSPVILITNTNINNINCKIIKLPIQNNIYSSLLGIIPIQLLAYYLSIYKDINPDIPKNLAKVVTIE